MQINTTKAADYYNTKSILLLHFSIIGTSSTNYYAKHIVYI